jgi:chaperone modulatory protein CbpM
MATTLVTAVVLDEEVTLSLAEMCRAADVCAEDLIAMVEEGVLEPSGSSPTAWRFPASNLRRLFVTVRLQRDLDLNLPGAALALDLLEEVQTLRRRLRAMEDS